MPSKLAKLASTYSHKIAAKLISLGAAPPIQEVTAQAIADEHGLQVIVIIAPYQGPKRIAPSVLERIQALATPKCPVDGSHGINGVLRPSREVESCIFEAAPVATERPIPIKQLAARAGYKCTHWFRDAVDALIVAGELVRTSQGVRRA